MPVKQAIPADSDFARFARSGAGAGAQVVGNANNVDTHSGTRYTVTRDTVIQRYGHREYIRWGGYKGRPKTLSPITLGDS